MPDDAQSDSFIERLIGAAKLNPRIYREVEYDPHALWQSFVVVMLASAGTWIGVTGRIRLSGILFAAAIGLIGWVIWTSTVYVIGVKLLPQAQTKATWGQLLHTTGFATGPGIISALGIFPSLTGFAPFITDLWILTAFVVAARRALDYDSTWRALAVCFMGWCVYAGAILILK